MAIAAPAVAASSDEIEDCLGLSWSYWLYTEALWGPPLVGWWVQLTPGLNACGGPCTLEKIEVWTTYSAPAVNTSSGNPQLVSSFFPDSQIGGPEPFPYDVLPAPWQVPPVDGDGTSLLPGYYIGGGHFRDDGWCVLEDLATSCDSRACHRLKDDDTYVRVLYSTPGGRQVAVQLRPAGDCPPPWPAGYIPGY